MGASGRGKCSMLRPSGKWWRPYIVAIYCFRSDCSVPGTVAVSMTAADILLSSGFSVRALFFFQVSIIHDYYSSRDDRDEEEACC